MGTWGAGTLDNDTAVDWMYGLGEVSDFSLVEGTLDRALECGDQMLAVPEAEEGIAAAEVVARLLGNPGVRNDYTRPMDDWISYMTERPSPELIEKARRVVARVREQPSALLTLWSSTPDGEVWLRAVARLAERLMP